MDEWLPQRHLAHFVVEVIEKLDLSRMTRDYRGSGSASYHPALLLALLVYVNAYMGGNDITGVAAVERLVPSHWDNP